MPGGAPGPASPGTPGRARPRDGGVKLHSPPPPPQCTPSAICEPVRSRPPPRPPRRAVPAGQHSCHDLASTPGYRQGILTVFIRASNLLTVHTWATESSAMLQLLLVLLGRIRRDVPPGRVSGLPP